MGYRSTMILGIAPKYKKEFEKTLKKHYEKEKVFELVKESKASYKDKDMLIYEGEYLKWYSEYDDVRDIEQLLNEANTKDEESCFLVGIAEDGVIHSEIGYYYDYVGISTTHEIY